MWSLGTTLYRSPTRGHAGWEPLRQQLSEARTTDAFGDWPLIASLAAELASIDHATELSGSPPFDRDGHRTFRSLINQLNRAHACIGDRLESRLQSALADVTTLASYSHATQAPPWEKLIEATRPLRASLSARGWSVVDNTISRHLTAPDDRLAGEGAFGPDTAAEEILASLRTRLDSLPW
jgi:hypothetical protein